MPALPGTLVPLDQQLPPLGKYLLGTAIALDTLNTGHVPDIDPTTATGRQAREYMAERQARIWPGLVNASGDGAMTRARARGQSSSPSQ